MPGPLIHPSSRTRPPPQNHPDSPPQNLDSRDYPQHLAGALQPEGEDRFAVQAKPDRLGLLELVGVVYGKLEVVNVSSKQSISNTPTPDEQIYHMNLPAYHKSPNQADHGAAGR